MGWFDEFASNIGHFFDLSPERNRQATENNKKALSAQTSAPGYKAPVGESGSAFGDLVSGQRGNEGQPGYVPPFGGGGGGGNAPAPTGLNSFPWMQSQPTTPSFDFGKDNGGQYTPDTSAMDSQLQSIKDRLRLNYSFDRSKVDTSDFDAALAARMALIGKAEGTANTNFATSDANLKGMHDAFQQDARAQTPQIQSQYDQSGADLKNIFDTTINANNAEQAKQQKVKEEMMQRLGIAPAAAQVDPSATAVANGNAVAAQGRDSRLAENVINKQSAVDNNNNFANVVGSEGVQRRSDLNSQLQDVLGKLSSQGLDYQDAAATRKQDFINGQDDKSYQRFLGDRNFDFSQLQQINSDNRETASRNAKAESDAIAARAKASGANQPTGFDGLWGQTPDDVKQAYLGMQGKVDPSNQQAVYKELQKSYPNVDAGQFLSFITNMSNLGSVNKFPAAQ